MKKNHQDLETRSCGLFLKRHNMFLSASPRLLVKCSCCGEGLVEIKCPYTCRNVSPREKPPLFLKSEKDLLNLKPSQCYFTQIQEQRGVTGRKWCDLFVYSKKGFHLQRIEFDKAYWFTLMMKLVYFFQYEVFHV